MEKTEWFHRKIENDERDVVAFRSWMTRYNDEGGYVDDDVEFHFLKDGYLWINEKHSSGQWVTLSPEQVQYLSHLFHEDPEVNKFVYGDPK